MSAARASADSLEILLSLPQPLLDITATDDWGNNVAWCSVLDTEEEEEGDRLRCVEMLCEDPRVDWNTRKEGETPLLFCLEEGQVEMAKILIKNPRVDLNVQNNAGEFPETIAR